MYNMPTCIKCKQPFNSSLDGKKCYNCYRAKYPIPHRYCSNCENPIAPSYQNLSRFCVACRANRSQRGVR